jgi:hypothetical protein
MSGKLSENQPLASVAQAVDLSALDGELYGEMTSPGVIVSPPNLRTAFRCGLAAGLAALARKYQEDPLAYLERVHKLLGPPP